MHAVLLSTDLMLISAAQGLADRAEVILLTAATAEEAIEKCISSAARLLAIDLRTPALDVAGLMDELRDRAGEVFVLAAGPHVQEQMLAAAAAAGCDEVATRGQFERALAAALGRLAAPKPR